MQRKRYEAQKIDYMELHPGSQGKVSKMKEAGKVREQRLGKARGRGSETNRRVRRAKEDSSSSEP